MLIVAGTITTGPDHRSRFLDAVQPMVAATLKEPGCREYCFSPDPNDDGRVMLFELWDDHDALDEHFRSDHMASWQDVRATLTIESADIKKYTISEVASL